MLLCRTFAVHRFVHVSAIRLVSPDQPLLGQDLQLLEDSRVGALTSQRLRDLANGAGTVRPENLEDGQLGFRRFSMGSLLEARLSTTIFVDVNTKGVVVAAAPPT